MRRLGLGGLYEVGLLAVLFLVVIHAPLAVGFGQLFPAYEELIKAWKEIALLVLAILAVLLVTLHKKWRVVLASRGIQFAILFIALHLAIAAVSNNGLTATVVGLAIDLRFVVMFGLMYVLVLLRPKSLSRAIKTVAAGAIAVVGFGLLQITVLPDDVLKGLGYSNQTITPFTTIDRNPDFVRINSTTRGPNPLGAMMVLYLSLLAAYLVYRRRKLSSMKKYLGLLGIAGSVAVLYASHSRSAFLAAAVVVTIIGTGVLRPTRKVVIGLGATLVSLGIALAVVAPTDWFSNVVLHEDPNSPVMVKSNDAHIESLGEGVRRVVAQPLGAGIGSTGSATLYDTDASNDFIVENSYFFIAHEAGWLGLALFMGLLVTVLTTLWRRRSSWLAVGLFASGIGLSLIGILLPVWADETVALTWWGLAGACAASGIIGTNHETRTRKQKTT